MLPKGKTQHDDIEIQKLEILNSMLMKELLESKGKITKLEDEIDSTDDPLKRYQLLPSLVDLFCGNKTGSMVCCESAEIESSCEKNGDTYANLDVVPSEDKCRSCIFKPANSSAKVFCSTNLSSIYSERTHNGIR